VHKVSIKYKSIMRQLDD